MSREVDGFTSKSAAPLVPATRFWFRTLLIGRDGTHLMKQVTQTFFKNSQHGEVSFELGKVGGEERTV